MDNSQIIEWIIGGLTAVAALFGKMQLDTLRETIKEQREEIDHIKEAYFKREDFRDFKSELWSRLDKMEASVETRLDKIARAYSLKDFPNL